MDLTFKSWIEASLRSGKETYIKLLAVASHSTSTSFSNSMFNPSTKDTPIRFLTERSFLWTEFLLHSSWAGHFSRLKSTAAIRESASSVEVKKALSFPKGRPSAWLTTISFVDGYFATLPTLSGFDKVTSLHLISCRFESVHCTFLAC